MRHSCCKRMAGPDDRDMSSLEAPPEDFTASLDHGIAVCGLRTARIWVISKSTARWPSIGASGRSCISRSSAARSRRSIRNGAIPSNGALSFRRQLRGHAGIACSIVWADKMDPGLVAYHAARTCATAPPTTVLRKVSGSSTTIRCAHSSRRYDVLLTPSLSVAAFPAGALDSDALGAASLGLAALGRLQLSL